MSEIDIESQFEQVKSKNKCFVLFYASWCPFSQRFLPIFQEYASKNPENCLRVKIDDKPEVCEKYSVEYYPTVIVFEKGRVSKRLDAAPGAGLNKKQFTELVSSK
jgi:thiol-disulfide isomerase/thioredoxin